MAGEEEIQTVKIEQAWFVPGKSKRLKFLDEFREERLAVVQGELEREFATETYPRIKMFAEYIYKDTAARVNQSNSRLEISKLCCSGLRKLKLVKENREEWFPKTLQ